MKIFELILFLIIAVVIFIYVVRHTNKWSGQAQQSHLDFDKSDIFGFNDWWRSSSARNISKVGIIFSTIIFLVLAAGLLFGQN
jgi:preprotein translocase subunit SecG